MNIEAVIADTNSFEEFKLKSGLSTDEALKVLKEKLKQLKENKKTRVDR